MWSVGTECSALGTFIRFGRRHSHDGLADRVESLDQLFLLVSSCFKFSTESVIILLLFYVSGFLASGDVGPSSLTGGQTSTPAWEGIGTHFTSPSTFEQLRVTLLADDASTIST